MNGEPSPQLGTVPLTQAILATWSNFDIARLCNPSAGLTLSVLDWAQLDVLPKHDFARIYGVPK
jgi:hypothetical protein